MGAAEGTWLRAENQTAGRGRQGRVWQEQPGNLYCSGLVRLRETDPPAHTLAFMAGLALYRALQTLSPDLPMMLKWPNDLLLNGGKAAGILLEREGDAVIVGIGLNLVSAPQIDGRKIVSVHDFLDEAPPSAESFLPVLAQMFETALEKWRSHPIENLFRAWQSVAHTLGAEMTVSLGAQAILGQFDGLSADGSLRLKSADGRVNVITAGDVELLSEKGGERNAIGD